MFETFLRDMTMLVAQVHATLMHLNDSFELRLDDKALHFIVMAVLGMLLFFAVHFVFKRLAKISISVLSFIYVFTVLLSLICCTLGYNAGTKGMFASLFAKKKEN